MHCGNGTYLLGQFIWRDLLLLIRFVQRVQSDIQSPHENMLNHPYCV